MEEKPGLARVDTIIGGLLLASVLTSSGLDFLPWLSDDALQLWQDMFIKHTVFQTLLLVAVGFAVTDVAGGGLARLKRIFASKANIFLVIFFVVSASSIFYAELRPPAVAAGAELAWYVLWVLLAAFFLRSKADIRLFLIGFLFVAAVTAECALFQNRRITGRGWFPFGNANMLGAYMIVPISMAVSLLAGLALNKISLPERFKRRKGLVLALLAAALLLFLAVLRRASWRESFLGTLLSSGVGGVGVSLFAMALIFTKGRARRLVAAAAVLSALLALGVFLASPPLQAKAKDYVMTSTLNIRWCAWDSAARMTAERPLLGWGAGNFPWVLTRFDNPAYHLYVAAGDFIYEAHNEYLQLLCEVGVLGLAALAAFFFFLFKGAARFIGGADDGLLKYLLIGLVCGFIGLMFSNAFGVNMRFKEIPIFFWTFAGVLAVLPIIERGAERGEDEAPRRGIETRLAAVLAYAVCAVFVWTPLVGRPLAANHDMWKAVVEGGRRNYGDAVRFAEQAASAPLLNYDFLFRVRLHRAIWTVLSNDDAAPAELRRVEKMAPGYGICGYWLAKFHLARGEPLRAFKPTIEALKYNPYPVTDIEAGRYLELIFKSADEATALGLIDENRAALSLSADEVIYLRGMARLARYEYAAALAEFGGIARPLGVRFGRPLYWKGLCLLRLGKIHETAGEDGEARECALKAKQAFLEYMKSEPYDGAAYVAVARSIEAAGKGADFKELKQLYDKGFTLNRRIYDNAKAYYDFLAANGRNDEATAMLESAVTARNARSVLFERLVRIYEGKGDIDDARRVLGRGIVAHPDNEGFRIIKNEFDKKYGESKVKASSDLPWYIAGFFVTAGLIAAALFLARGRSTLST